VLVANLGGLGLGLLAIGTLSSDVLFRNRFALKGIAGDPTALHLAAYYYRSVTRTTGIDIGKVTHR